MKTAQQLCAVLALTLVLSLTAFAGDMSCGVTSTTPPPQQQSQTEACGDMSCGVASTDEATSDAATLTEVALGLIQNVLALF